MTKEQEVFIYRSLLQLSAMTRVREENEADPNPEIIKDCDIIGVTCEQAMRDLGAEFDDD